MNPHNFRHDPTIPVDPYKARRWCICGRLEANAAHTMPPEDQATDIAAIRTGDTDTGDD